MLCFDIEPFVGGLPIRFGMSRREVVALLGPPNASQQNWDKSGTTDFWCSQNEVNVGYDNGGTAVHLGFAAGCLELRFRGTLVWTPDDHSDPNPLLLEYDLEPLETLGFLVFRKIGVITTGFHDDDVEQRALTVFPQGAWDSYLTDAKMPDLNRYR